MQTIRADLTSPKGIDELLSAVQNSFGTLPASYIARQRGFTNLSRSLRFVIWTGPSA